MRTNARALSKIEADLEGELKREAESPIKIGRLLIKAKELLDAHGEWLPWLKDHFPHARRTAQNYMAAGRFADKYATVAHLKLTAGALYELAGRDNGGDGELVQAVLAKAATTWIDRDDIGAIADELRQPPASDHDDGSEPPALPPPAPALTPKKAALVEAFDRAIEAFGPLLAKRTADFVASGKPDHELMEIANFLTQIVAARQPVIDEPKQLPPPQPEPSPTIELEAHEYTDATPESDVEVISQEQSEKITLAALIAATGPIPDAPPPAPELSDAWSRVGELTKLLPKHGVQQPEPKPIVVETVTRTEALSTAAYVRDAQPEPATEHERKMARGEGEVVGDDLVERGRMSEENNGEWKITAKGKGKNNLKNPMRQPVDLAAEAAKLGLSVSPRAAA